MPLEGRIASNRHRDQEELSPKEYLFVSKGIHSKSVESFWDGIRKTNMYSSGSIHLYLSTKYYSMRIKEGIHLSI